MKNRRLQFFVLLCIGLVLVVTSCCSLNVRDECPTAGSTSLTLEQAFVIALKKFQSDAHADLEKQIITITRNIQSKHWTFSFDVEAAGPGTEYSVFVFDDGTAKVLPGM